jgi:hypothetical protein
MEMKKNAVILVLLLFMLTSAACGSEKTVFAYDIYSQATAAMDSVKSLAADTNVKMKMSTAGMDFEVAMSGAIKAVTLSENDVEMQLDMLTSFMGQDIELKAFYKDGVYYLEADGQKTSMAMPLEQIQKQANIEALSFPDTAIKDQQMTNKDGGKELSFTLDGTVLSDTVTAQMGDLTALLGEGAEMTIGDVDYAVFIDKQGNLKSTQMSFSMEMGLFGETMPCSMEISMDYVQINNVSIDFPADLDAYEPMDIQF